MFDALKARDLYLVAGCAAAGAVFLAAGTLLADVALAYADPRVRTEETRVVTRRAARVMLAFVAVALVAPWLAPYEDGRTFREFLHAPPMRPVLSGAGAPGAHPLVLADRLEQRYEPDTSRTVPLPWFAAASDTPVFLLGADNFGRDVLSRLFHGARTSMGLALVATLGAVLIGALAGAWAGYCGGWVDESVMRLADFILVLPVIYVVLVLRAVLPLVLPASIVFLLMAVIFVARGMAVRGRAASAPSWPASATRNTCRPRGRSAPAPAACSRATSFPRVPATWWCRPRCCCRPSSWPRPRCRLSAWASRTKWPRGGRC